MKSLIENYFKFRESMDDLSQLVPSILVQDALKNELGHIRNNLVEPMNKYSALMLKIKGQSQPEDDF